MRAIPSRESWECKMRITIPARRGAGPAATVGLALALSLGLSACSLGGTSDEPADDADSPDGPANTKVVLASHAPWSVPEEVLRAATTRVGKEWGRQGRTW